MKKYVTGAALTGVAVLTFGAGAAFAGNPNNCSDACNVGGKNYVGDGTAVGPAQGFHYTVLGYPGYETFTNVGNSNAGHVDSTLSDGSRGTRSGAWVEQLGIGVGHTTGYYGDCSGLDC